MAASSINPNSFPVGVVCPFICNLEPFCPTDKGICIIKLTGNKGWGTEEQWIGTNVTVNWDSWICWKSQSDHNLSGQSLESLKTLF